MSIPTALPGLTIRERLMRRTTKREDGCWIWSGYTWKGYGRTKVDGRMQWVHRVAYEEYVGPIPDGMTIDHLCFTPACINPEHLRPLSNLENAKRQRTALSPTCSRGHLRTPENTMQLRSGSRACRICTRERKREWEAARRALGSGPCPPVEPRAPRPGGAR